MFDIANHLSTRQLLYLAALVRVEWLATLSLFPDFGFSVFLCFVVFCVWFFSSIWLQTIFFEAKIKHMPLNDSNCQVVFWEMSEVTVTKNNYASMLARRHLNVNQKWRSYLLTYWIKNKIYQLGTVDRCWNCVPFHGSNDEQRKCKKKWI